MSFMFYANSEESVHGPSIQLILKLRFTSSCKPGGDLQNAHFAFPHKADFQQ